MSLVLCFCAPCPTIHKLEKYWNFVFAKSESTDTNGPRWEYRTHLNQRLSVIRLSETSPFIRPPMTPHWHTRRLPFIIAMETAFVTRQPRNQWPIRPPVCLGLFCPSLLHHSQIRLSLTTSGQQPTSEKKAGWRRWWRKGFLSFFQDLDFYSKCLWWAFSPYLFWPFRS